MTIIVRVFIERSKKKVGSSDVIWVTKNKYKMSGESFVCRKAVAIPSITSA